MYAHDTIRCDGAGCGAGIIIATASGEKAQRRGAAREGWSTARGRDLCPACTARHNAALRP